MAANRKILVFGTAAALLAVVLLALLLSRGNEKSGVAQEAIAVQPAFGAPGQLGQFASPSNPSEAAQQSPPIAVLNAQSYPSVGGNWTVAFTTSGTSDLVIAAVNGTAYGRDIGFLELRCGEAIARPQLLRGDGGRLLAVRAANWSCINRTAYHTVKVLTQGSHSQQLTFGTQSAIAHNLAGSPTIGVSYNANTQANITINGSEGGDNLGYSVSAGDVNGDGINDTIIGAYSADPVQGANAGKVYVFYGSALTGYGFQNSFDANSSANVTINGSSGGDNLGSSVAAGDVNGDGKADVIAGAYSADPVQGANAGKVYVFYGSALTGYGFQNSFDANSSANVTVNGSAGSDILGVSVAAGDVNGDGKADVIAGAYTADPVQGISAGKAYVFYGSALTGYGVANSFDANTQANITINGSADSDFLGISVSGGDVNGDGKADVIAGAYGATPVQGDVAGKVYVFYGSALTGYGVANSFDANASANITINGSAGGDILGSSVAAGDVNGDGRADVLAGAYLADPVQGAQAGKAYVFYGSALTGYGFQNSFDANSSANVTVNGSAGSDNLGYSVSAGDVNGDGRADVLAGAYLATPVQGANAGKAYVFYGSALTGYGMGNSFDANTQANITINGSAGSDQLGSSVAAGDVNGDGRADVLAGAYPADPVQGISAGKAYVFFSFLPPDTTPPLYNLSNNASATTLTNGVVNWSINMTDETALANFTFGFNDSGSFVNDTAVSISGASFSANVTKTITAAAGKNVCGAFYIQDSSGNRNDSVYSCFTVAAPSPIGGVSYDASTSANFTINGSAGGDNLGVSVAFGDFNGDGFNDAIVGANFANPVQGSSAGKVYVFYGSGRTGYGVVNSFDANLSANITINGSAGNDQFGVSVGAGDVNGDGKADVIAGAYGADSVQGINSGKVYVFYGSGIVGYGVVNSFDANLSANITINGSAGSDTIGYSVFAGDVSGDGKADVIAGAAMANTVQGAGSGKVYVFYGSGIVGYGVVNSFDANSSANVTVNGSAGSDNLGISVGAGDVNGDGRADVIAGAYLADPVQGANAGKAYVFYGSSITGYGVVNSFNANMLANITINGSAGSDQLGVSVGAGDVNGDGRADVIVGANTADPVQGANAGKAYVLYGSSLTGYGVANSFDANSSANVTVNGSAGGDSLGVSVGAGDVSGDGRADVIVGANTADPVQGANAGKAYVLYGSSLTGYGVANSFDANSSANVTVNGSAGNDRFGYFVSAGDVSGDGRADVIAGAYLADLAQRVDAGKVYVFFSEPSTPPLYNLSNNASATTLTNGVVNWSINMTDEIALSAYTFGFNDSGSFVNDTVVSISGTSFSANVTKTITAAAGKSVCGAFYINDSSGNTNNSAYSCFTVFVPALQAPPNATPFITNTNATQIPNSSIAMAAEQLFGFANFSSGNATTEVNSTFKWFKRTLYQPQNRSLVGYWKLDGNANDSSGFGNHGNISGATSNQSQNCRIDDCLFFDGVNDNVTVADSPVLQLNGSFTLEAWILPYADSSGVGRIMDKEGSGSGYSFFVNWSNGNLSLLINKEAAANASRVKVAAGVWNHVAVAYNMTHFAFYINGTSAGADASGSGVKTNATRLFIGANTSSGANFNGSIDEAAIYNYAKSAGEIWNDYRNSTYSAMVYKDAVLYLHLDRVNGSNVTPDSSGYGNNGALYGFNQSNASAAGIIGNGLQFDGIDDYVDAGNAASLNLSTKGTITAWIKLSIILPAPSFLPTIVSNENQQTNRNGYSLTLSQAKLMWGMASNTASQGVIVTAGLQANRWYHVALSWDTGSNVVTYLNGVAIDTTASTVTPAPAYNLLIGKDPVLASSFFNGSIDEVAIYNRSLSAEEIKQLYLRSWYDYSPQQFLLRPSYPDELANDTRNTTLLLHFDDGIAASPNVSDSSPYGNNGNVSGAFFTNDSISGSALRFDGIDDHVNVSRSSSIEPSTQITLEAWIKPNSGYGNSFPRIIDKSAGTGANQGYYLTLTAADGTVQWFADLSVSGVTTLSTAASAPVGVWTHLAATYDGSAMRIFMNGVERASQGGLSGAIDQDASQILTIGNDGVALIVRSFNGTIDEVKIVNRSLSAAEIAADYRRGVPFATSDGEMPTTDPYSSGVRWQPGRLVENLSLAGNYANTTLYLRMDEGSGQNVSDISSYGSTGVLGADGNSGADDPTRVNDSVGEKALKFDGVNDFVNLSSPAAVRFGVNNFTVEAWFKTNGTKVHQNSGLVTKGSGGVNSYWQLFLLADGTLQWCNANGVSSNCVLTATAYADAAWHHVAAVRSGTGIGIYADGAHQNSTALTSAYNTDSALSLIIGSQDTSIAASAFNGTIDEVRIINRSLNASEILADYRKAAKGLGLLSNGYINYSAVNNFNEKEGAIEFWVKPEWNGNDGLAHVLFDTETAADFNITKTAGNDLAVFVGNPNSVLVRKNITNWTSGLWRHVGVSWSNYTSNVTLYVDGSRVNNSGTAFVIPAAAAGKSFLVGAMAPGTSGWCNCTFSDFRISRKALSAQEINESFSKGRQLYSNEFMLNNSNFRKGDSFKVEYTPGDSQAAVGNSSNSSIMVIVNSAPSEPAVTDFGREGADGTPESVAANKASSATPANATFLTAVNITWNAAADNDFDTVSYNVLINNTLICSTTATSCNTTQLPNWNGNSGFYIFNVTAFDGDWNSTTTAYAFNFDNSTTIVTIVATTAANNTFQNATSHFINFTVNGGSADRVILNITGPSFAGTGGAGSSSSGRNITLWDKDLLGMWHFEDGNGSRTANDSSGSEYHGNLSSMNFTGNATSGWTASGRLGAGLIFDGNDDYVNLGNAASLDFTDQDFSVFLWVKVNRFNAVDGPTYFSRGLWQVDGWYFQSDTLGDLYFTSSQAGANQLISGDTDLNTGIWNHIGFVRNGSTVTFYANGTSYAGSGPIQNPVGNGARQAAIGAYGSAFNTYMMNGTIDEVKVWKRALTAAEVSAEYNRTASNYLVAHNFSGSSHLFSANLTNLSSGNYSYFVWVNGSRSQVATTQPAPRSLTVDAMGPDITYDASSFANGTLNKFVTINVTANDTNNDHNELSAFVDFNGSLIGYWRFEDDGDTNASDFTRNNNNGTLANFGCVGLNCNLTGGTYGAGSGWTSGGKRGRALVFDGSDDLVNVTDSPSLRVTGNLTLEAWVYPLAAPAAGNNYAVIGKATTATVDYLLFVNASHVGFNTSSQGISSAVRQLPVGAWSYVAATFDGANVRIYFNGLLNAAVAQTAALSSTSGHLAVGSHGGNAASFFNGTVDEVKVWNRTLSAGEINASYSGGKYGLIANISASNYPDGNFTYTAYVVDAAGNVNRTEERLVIIDNTAPVIAAIRTFSNSSQHYYQASNATSAVVAYFNSEAPAATADGGGGQAVTFEVTYTDLYRNSLAGNLTFGMVPYNHTPLGTSTITYNISTGLGNATALVMANDTANNTATATVRFVLDINDTVTTDNSSSGAWYLTNVTINLTAVDVANGSGANRTLWCAYTAGTSPCTPAVEVFNPSGDFRLPVNCSTGESCQIRLRYYSIDNVSNNESGGANGGTIRESNTININTGGSDVQDSIINNSAILNGSFVRASNITNSTVNMCRVINSVVVRSVLFRNPDHVHNCTVSDSFVLDSNITSSIIEKQSYVDPSVIIDSVITNSTIHNSSVSFSRVENSTFCGNFSVWTAAILNNTLIDGRITFNGSNYFGPVALNSICAGVPSSPVGSLVAAPSIVNNSAVVVFRYASASTGYSVAIGQPELFALDNTSAKPIALNDNGNYPDEVANDAVYSGNYTISPLNNQSDGNKTIVAQVSDSLGNNWTVRANVTLDNTKPNATISIFGLSPAGFTNASSEYTFSRAVTLVMAFNDTSGISNCRFANENQQFTGWEACQTARSWLLSDGNGNKTVILETRDVAGNVNRTNDTISLNTTVTSVDQTPPTTPTVVDDGLYTNANVALHAKWNATDYENDLLHIPLEWEYRIAFDNFTRRINDTWQYAGAASETTVYGMNLSDGANYTFEVRAINTAGLRSANGTSNGIIVDTAPPGSPLVNSTASQTAWTSNNVVAFNFTAVDNVSGVESFSYVLDASATTIPDNVPESMNQHTPLSSSYNDGKSTIIKFNSTGNASAVFVEVRSNLSANDVVRVTLQLAESSVESPDAMGYVVYAIASPPTGFDMTGSNISLIVNTSRDIAFVRSVLDATAYTVDVPMSTAVTGSRFFVAIAGDQNDDDNRLNLLLAVSNTSVDSSTQSYRCQEGVSGCSNTTVTADYGIKAELRDLKQDNIWHRTYTVGDGRMYFHVKAKDSAGNIGDAANYTLLIDTSAPSTPQMNQTSQYTNTSSVTFNWTQSLDADSGVGNYSLQVDNNSDFSSPEYYSWVGNVTNRTVTGLTTDATYYARVHSSNLAGVNSSWSSSVSTVIDTTAPSITFSKPSSVGVVASQDVALVVQTSEKAICTYSGNGGTEPYRNFTFTNSTYHETMVSAAAGSNTFSMQCKDTVLNTVTASISFTLSASSTASSITLQSPSVFSGDVARTNLTVTTSSGQPLGEIGSAAFALKLNGDAVGLSVFDRGAGNYTLVFDAPPANGTYVMAVTVGSATATATLNVQALLFTVQYAQSGVAANTGDRLIYFVAGNFSLGLAADSRNVMRSSTGSALNMTSNARDGTAYIFVTRTGGNVERMESLLKEKKFLDVINPSFGYAVNLNTFVVYTDLEYDAIALSGNKTLTTGRYNLIIENKGFDATVNKTKLEVRVQ